MKYLQASGDEENHRRVKWRWDSVEVEGGRYRGTAPGYLIDAVWGPRILQLGLEAPRVKDD